MYRLDFYVPESHLERVKTALFEAGVGNYGKYDQCCWQTSGQGQFRPLQGAIPFSGEIGRLQKEPEVKVEMLCAKEVIKCAVSALKLAHPYEMPAYACIRLDDI